MSPASLLFVTIATGLLTILPFYLGELATGARPVFTPGTLAAMAYVGIFPSAVAYLFWNRGVAEVGGNRAGIFIHLMPVFGTLLAAAFLGEDFHAYHAFGFALILGGIALTTRRNAQSA
jgi:drug/metabolite transporter (DMT)-like permease